MGMLCNQWCITHRLRLESCCYLLKEAAEVIVGLHLGIRLERVARRHLSSHSALLAWPLRAEVEYLSTLPQLSHHELQASKNKQKKNLAYQGRQGQPRRDRGCGRFSTDEMTTTAELRESPRFHWPSSRPSPFVDSLHTLFFINPLSHSF